MKKKTFKASSVKWGNIYDKDGNLLRRVDETTGKIKPYSIEELEQLCNDLDPESREYKNSVGVLLQMYQNPKTKEDKEYIRKKQQELLESLQRQAENNKKRSEESVVSSLKEINEQLDNNIQDAEFEEVKDKNNETDRK